MGKRRWPFVLIVLLQQTWRQVCSTERRPFRAEPCLFYASSRVQTPTSVNTEGKAGSPADICESLRAATNHTGWTCRWLRVEATPEPITLAFPKTTRGTLMHHYGSHLNVNVAKCLMQIRNVPKRSQEETQQQQEDSVQTDSTLFSAHTLNRRPRIGRAVSSKLCVSDMWKRQDYKSHYIAWTGIVNVGKMRPRSQLQQGTAFGFVPSLSSVGCTKN